MSLSTKQREALRVMLFYGDVDGPEQLRERRINERTLLALYEKGLIYPDRLAGIKHPYLDLEGLRGASYVEPLVVEVDKELAEMDATGDLCDEDGPTIYELVYGIKRGEG